MRPCARANMRRGIVRDGMGRYHLMPLGRYFMYTSGVGVCVCVRVCRHMHVVTSYVLDCHLLLPPIHSRSMVIPTSSNGSAGAP